MIVGIGCDIVEHVMTEDLKWDTDIVVQKRIFSEKEIALSSQKTIKFLAGRFAAKESVLKCLGTGMEDGISLIDIQILQSDCGKPIVELSGEVKKISDDLGISSWHVSISHSLGYSFAYIIAER